MKNEEEKQKQGKKSKKHPFFSIFWKFCVVLVLVMIAALGVAIVKLDSILKFSLEKAGSYVTQTPVTVEKIQLKILEGKLIIRNLAIANPSDYGNTHAMAIQEAYVFLDVKSLLSPEIHVREVKLDGAEVSYVARGFKDNNISDIYQNIQRLIPVKDPTASKPEAKPEPPADPAQKKGGKKVVIDQVNITNTKFALGVKFLGDSSLDLTISDIHLKDLGKEKEMSTTEAITKIFDEFFKGVNSVVDLTGRMVDDTKEAFKETGRVLKELFRKNKKSRKDNESAIAPADGEIKVNPEPTEPAAEKH